MINQQYTGRKGTYTISRLLGKGGEGEVFELADHPTLVLKIYSEPLTPAKAAKLQLMVNRHNEQMQAYAAWPSDLVTDKKGKPAGFVMKKLDQFVPLHMLFSPMDRKKIFPDKGYNFLVHVARNVASAFHTLHAAGLVVGDVNEGNLLVNNQGMVAFIDCDSFQLSDGNQYYFCEVGVPRYTPPELLKLASFENVVRTTSTDAFSMAILIFQLLFLGRHPFAGINHSSEDIPEETAIQRQLFAYSRHNRQKLLTPPKDSFDINHLPDSLTALFHQAFESAENRPSPTLWIKETNQLLQQMATCTKSKLHTYPDKITSCPWCDFRNKRNILYFIDDVYQAETSIPNDFDRFINGFRIEPLYIPPVDLSNPINITYQPLNFNAKLRSYKRYQSIATLILLAASIALFRVSTLAGCISLAFTGMAFVALPWKKKIDTELKKLKDRHQQLTRKFNQSVNAYENNQDSENYDQLGKKISMLVMRYGNLPKEIQLKKRSEEERIYNQQLHTFLQQFLLQQHQIPNFGATRKQALYNAGIISASDISRLSNVKVQGIGPKFEQALFSWQRQMASQFVYHPDNNQLNKSFLKILDDAALSKQQLEQEIRTNYGNLQQMKLHITSKRVQLQTHINELKKHIGQAYSDLQAFKQLVK